MKKKVLIVAQDLRVSGTSEGVVSRSFISRLREMMPNAYIRIIYLKTDFGDDQLNLLPVDEIKVCQINNKYPLLILWINKIYWRLFHMSLKDIYIQKKYREGILTNVNGDYDYVFLRSSGVEYESILALNKTDLLAKAYINFHDPYPIFWDPGSKHKLNALTLFKLKSIVKVVDRCNGVFSPSQVLSLSLKFLYNSNKIFHTIPHQFDPSVFNLSTGNSYRKKEKKIQLSYHGAIQSSRNIDIVIEAFQELLIKKPKFFEKVELVLRLRGVGSKKYFQHKYIENIQVLDCLDFHNSYKEQRTQSDICLILETCDQYSVTLAGKTAVLNELKKPLLILSPSISELRRISNNLYVANCNEKKEIYSKLDFLISSIEQNKSLPSVFNDYFSLENFRKQMDMVLES